jgi:hypothetical protein
MHLQKGILHAVKEEARGAKLRARQLRPVTLPSRPGPPAEGAGMLGSEDEGDSDTREQFHQGIDGDGIVRDLPAYLEGALSVVRKRLPLVFPLQASEANSNVRIYIGNEMLPACLHIIMYYLFPVLNVVARASFTCSHAPVLFFLLIFWGYDCTIDSKWHRHPTAICMHTHALAFYICLLLTYHMLQAKQYIILSITVSHRNHDIDPSFLIAVLGVLLVRYTTGVFSDTSNTVIEGSPTQLWAAVALERGLTNNRCTIREQPWYASITPVLIQLV